MINNCLTQVSMQETLDTEFGQVGSENMEVVHPGIWKFPLQQLRKCRIIYFCLGSLIYSIYLSPALTLPLLLSHLFFMRRDNARQREEKRETRENGEVE